MHQYENDQNKYKFYRTRVWNEVPKQVPLAPVQKRSTFSIFLLTLVHFQSKVKKRDKIVLKNGVCEIS